MQILVLNSGSSTLKFDLIDVGDGAGIQQARKLAHGLVDRIGGDSAVDFQASSGASERRQAAVRDHKEAVAEVFAWLDKSGVRGEGLGVRDTSGGQTLTPNPSPLTPDAVGHRVVHGGDRFVSPTLIDDSVLRVLEELSDLAPLHNPAALQAMRAAREILGPDMPMVAVFDTAFHSTLPQHAAAYALPHDLAQRHKIRRYGFHGIAHEYMLTRYAEMTGTPAGSATLVTLQLGNGCSAAAIRDGRSVDTSMGFTPLEGLVMGTRSGDLDPGIVAYLARKEQVDAQEVERWLNKRSGLLGLSGLSSDMRDLLAVAGIGDRGSGIGSDGGPIATPASGYPRSPIPATAELAVEVFCYRVRKYIGAYLAALGGAQAIVFGGGIGEHSPEIRSRICSGMEWCGLRLDPARNARATGAEERISADDSTIQVYVIPVDESALIARYTAAVISGQ